MRRLLVLILIVLAVYVAYPYWTLHRLDQALLSNNKETLERIVDFPAVRASLKAQVEDNVLAKTQELGEKRPVLGDVGEALARALGPALIGGTVDGLVTPESVLNSPTVVEHREKNQGFWDFVTYAFFSAPTEFNVDLRDPDKADAPTISTFLTLDGARWRVTKVDLPPLKTLIPEVN